MGHGIQCQDMQCPLCDPEDKEKVAVQVQNEWVGNSRHPRHKIPRCDIYRKTRVEHSYLTHQWRSKQNARLSLAKSKKMPKVNQRKGIQSPYQT